MMNKETNYSNIREIIYDCAEKYPNNNAFIIKNKDMKTYTNITFRQLKEDMIKLGTSFLKLGLKDRRIAIIGKNRYEWALCYYSAVNGIGTVVPLDKGLPEDEIENSLMLSKADTLIFEEKYYETVKQIVERGKTSLSTLICMDKFDDKVLNVPDLIKQGEEALKNGDEEFEKLEIDNNAIRIILFTSGTTSIAKAVMLTHYNIASNINGLRVSEKIYSTDINMAFLPFHHTFGSTGLLLFLSNGATTVFCDGLRYIQKNLKEYHVNVFFCVPLIIEAMHKKIIQTIEKQHKTTMVKIAKAVSKFLLLFKIDIRRKLFKSIIDELGGLRFAISGAAALDKNVQKDFNDFGILTVCGYGLTETSPVLTCENEYYLRPGSIGKELHGVEVKIDNPNEDGIGEIIARGPNVMKGYYENEEATNDVLIDGWFHTGDLGYKDKDGFFYISGRKKNVIVLKNGKNIYPEELEILVGRLPYVIENIVFGIPKDDDYSLSTKIVYSKEYAEEHFKGMQKEDIKAKVWEDIKKINDSLPNYKHIKSVIITDEPMIKTSTGKVKRNEEIKQYV